jgi:hypothetical protein
MVLVSTASQLASASALQFVCTYPKFFAWNDAKPGEAKDFVLKFSLDTLTKKAFLTGNQGVEEVRVVNGDGGITFIEVLDTGAVQTTTISKDGRSVHSRHTIMFGELVPSQYVGQCSSSRP